MTETELLQEILKELKGIRTDLTHFKQDTQQQFTEVKANIKTLHGVLGELQGDIEEIQEDTQYLSMRKLLEKKRAQESKLLHRFTPSAPSDRDTE